MNSLNTNHQQVGPNILGVSVVADMHGPAAVQGACKVLLLSH
jgi:hypothetical protein